MKGWTREQIKNHTEAGKKLAVIKEEVKNFLSKTVAVSELETISFIKKRYKHHGLVNDKPKESCIAAFGKHTNEVHYFPNKNSNAVLAVGDIILIDMWARLPEKNAPYADATFMFYFGKKIPKDIQKTWKILTEARDKAIKYIEQCTSIQRKNDTKNKTTSPLPRGLDIDRVAHDIIGNTGLGRGIKHTIGHSLGFDSPHGKLPGINWREYSPILKNVGYTIEPGIYLEQFGMRTEIDFYITKEGKIVITTPLQDEIELLH